MKDHDYSLKDISDYVRHHSDKAFLTGIRFMSYGGILMGSVTECNTTDKGVGLMGVSLGVAGLIFGYFGHPRQSAETTLKFEEIDLKLKQQDLSDKLKECGNSQAKP